MIEIGSSSPLRKAREFQEIFDNQRYSHLLDWHRERDEAGNYIPIRKRAPHIRYNLAKAICQEMAGFLMGHRPFPTFQASEYDLADSLDWLRTYYLLKQIPTACLDACVQGSCGISFGWVRGKLLMRTWRRSEATPIFDDSGELLALVALFDGEHPKTGKSVQWRMTLDAMEETWEFRERSIVGNEDWSLHETIKHEMGFVPAVWVRHLVEAIGRPDGISLLESLPELLKEIDYSYSRRGRSLDYSADPQAIIRDQDPEDFMKRLMKSPAGTWFFGEKGDAKYLEISGEGIKLQGEFASDLRRRAQEISRVFLPDPERLTGQHMSGFALRVLYGPQIALADQLKVNWTTSLLELVAKILESAVIQRSKNRDVYMDGLEGLDGVPRPDASNTEDVEMRHPLLREVRRWPRPYYVMERWGLSASWGPYFDTSPEEEESIMRTAAAGRSAGIISQDTAIRMTAPHTGVGNIDEELSRIQHDSGFEVLI